MNLPKLTLLTGFFLSSIIAFSQVDLIITSPTLSPASVAAGSSVSVSCYIYNQGTVAAASSNVGYYLSTDAIWDAGDTYLNYSAGASLGASSSSYRSASLVIPTGTATGSYYILYYADYSNAVSETVETNNVSSMSLTVVPSVVDLIIQNQSASPTSLAAGSSISLSCYIYNQGTTLASSSNVGFYLSTDAVWDAGDTYLTYYAGTSLAASTSSYRSTSATIPSGTTPGTYYILYYADYSNAVPESIETNNVVSVAINVQSPVIDLIIQSQTASPTSVAAGSTVNVSCYIYNQGNVLASSSNVGYYLSTDAIWDAGDTYLNYTAGTSLAAATSSYRSSTVTIPSGTTPGSYYLLFYADYSNAVAENVETNNVVAIAVSVITPIVDLTIQNQSASPVSVAAGGTVNASCYIYNQGNVLVSSSNVGYYLSADAIWDAGDTYLNYTAGTSLAAGTTASRSSILTIPSGTTPGSYYLLFYADYSNAVAENIETNNVNYVAITVAAPVIDLTIQSQTASPLTIASGSTTNVSCYIYNQGNTSAATSNVGYYLSADATWDAGDTYLSYTSGSTLAAATSSYRSTTLTIPSGTAAGNYYILYYADYSNVVAENIETNNVNYVAVTVAAPVIDLIVQSQSLSPLTVAAGSTTNASCYVYNQGNTSASSSNVGFYLSVDAIWDAGDTYLNYSSGSTLASGTSSLRSSTLTIPSGTVPGAYYILYFADYSNVVAENIETNNVVSVPVSVVAPSIDLIVQSQTAPATAVAGNSISASCYIYNQGNSTASTSNVGYYLSADAIWDAGDTYLNYTAGSTLAATSSSYRSTTLTIPSGTIPGNYYILYFADYSNTVSETVESNNVAASAITIAAPSIDLVIQSQTASPSSVLSGSSVSVSCYIYNQGNSTASTSNVGYYLSTDAVWDAADVYLNYSSGSSLGAATNSYRSASVAIPSGTTAGSYYILYYADYSNTVSETVETNNVAAFSISVITPGIDLIIQTPTVSPSSAIAGNSVSASCYIYNQGNSTAASANVGFYLSTDGVWDAGDALLYSSMGSSLAAATSSYRSVALTIPSGTTAGSYYILYYADYSAAVSETAESNNVSSLPITVSAAAIDLVIQTQTVTPTTISAGGNIAASCNIYNQGNSTAASSTVGYYLSTDGIWDAGDVLLNNSAGTSLNASTSSVRSATLNIPASTPAGPYYIIFFADYLLSVSETLETNNYQNIPITVTPFTNIIQLPLSGTSQYSICTGTIYDDGGSAANYGSLCSGTTTLLPASSGNVVQLVFNSFAVESCCDYLQIYDGPNTSSTLIGTFTSNPGTITATNPQGALTLHFYSDGSVQMGGFDATISCISAGALPDLSPVSLTCAPFTIPQNGSANATCQVLNSGSSTAGASILGYYLSADTVWNVSDVLLNSDAVSTLTASATYNSSKSITIPGSTALGNYYLLFVADTGLAITENVETNNVKWLSITVTITIGVSEVDDNKNITVYPNPSNGQVNFLFEGETAASADVRIFDCVGQLVDAFTSELSPQRETLSSRTIQVEGIYFAEIKIGEAVFYKKIIIQ